MRGDIVIVSGLPRSGTSMMMRMLEAGGIAPFTDAVRAADSDNPLGYYEYEPVKRLDKDGAWMGQATGKALKVVSSLLEYLPPGYAYSVIFMNRAIDEVLASQQAMLLRRVEQGDIPSSAASPENLRAENVRLHNLYSRHLLGIRQWMSSQPNIRTTYIEHRRTVREPVAIAEEVARFLEADMDVSAMAGSIDPKLYRQRS